jgi:hypothetical protein
VEEVSREDEAIPSGSPTRWLVAVHEAAHAVYAHKQGIEVECVTIEGIVAVENGGERDTGDYLGWCGYDWDGEAGRNDLMGCTRCLVGNAAMHKAGWPEPLLPYERFLRVAEEADDSESDAGIILRGLDCVENPEALYEEAREDAEAFVEDHWTKIVTLAETLMEKVSMSSTEVNKVLGPGWLDFRKMLDEIARDDDLAEWVKVAMREFGVEDPDLIVMGPDAEPLLDTDLMDLDEDDEWPYE